MVSSHEIYPGLNAPTTRGLTSGTPATSAYHTTQANAQRANSLKNAVGGSRKRRKNVYSKKRRFKGGTGITVPQFHTQYNPQNGPGQSPNDQIKDNASTSTQNHAWAVYDKNATNMQGGSSRSNLGWKCMSGGKDFAVSKKKRKKLRKKKSLKKYKQLNRNNRMHFFHFLS